MSLIKLKNIVESEGILTVTECNQLKFEPKRLFYVTDVPSMEERGQHAHYNCQQYLICIQGNLIVKLFDGFKTNEYLLNPREAIFVDKLIWDSQIYKNNAIMLSLCSHSYDPKDYINNIDEFIKIKQDSLC